MSRIDSTQDSCVVDLEVRLQSNNIFKNMFQCLPSTASFPRCSVCPSAFSFCYKIVSNYLFEYLFFFLALISSLARLAIFTCPIFFACLLELLFLLNIFCHFFRLFDFPPFPSRVIWQCSFAFVFLLVSSSFPKGFFSELCYLVSYFLWLLFMCFTNSLYFLMNFEVLGCCCHLFDKHVFLVSFYSLRGTYLVSYSLLLESIRSV